jgi:hypothetical protein
MRQKKSRVPKRAPSPSIEEFETFCPVQTSVPQMRFYLTRPLILQYICSNHYY